MLLRALEKQFFPNKFFFLQSLDFKVLHPLPLAADLVSLIQSHSKPYLASCIPFKQDPGILAEFKQALI